jgi:tetratricopeptide (TPR) repeat protein
MTESIRRAGWITVVLLLAGCAGVANLIHGKPSVEEVESLRERGEYGRALGELDRLRRAAPDSVLWGEMEARIRSEGEAFVRDRIVAAETHRQEGDWRGAAGALSEVERRYPSSDSLAVAREDFESRRSASGLKVEKRLALARARGLLAELPHLEELSRLRFEDRALARRLADTRDELQDLHKVLMATAEESLESGETEVAEECLTAAARINPSRVVVAALEQLRRPEPAVTPAPIPRPEPQPVPARTDPALQARQRLLQQQEAAARSLEAARDALTRNDLMLARSHLERAARNAPDSEGVLALRQEIEQRVSIQVRRLDEAGRRDYVEGHYEAAAESWKQALELEPENEGLKQQLARVERVLENLKRLRDVPPGQAS